MTSTYTTRRSAEWDDPWIDAGETLDEAIATAIPLGVPGSPTFMTIRNAFNHSAAVYEVYGVHAAWIRSLPDWEDGS